MIDDTGNMVQETVRLGEKAGDGSELAEGVGKAVKEGSVIQDTRKIPGTELTREQRLIEFTDSKERSIAEFLEDQGRTVIKNPQEGVAGAGRQGDSFMDGVKTEFKSLDPGATDGTIKNVVNKSIANGGQARQIVIDARGAGLSEELALKGTYRALGASNGKLDFIEVIGDGYFFRSAPKN